MDGLEGYEKAVVMRRGLEGMERRKRHGQFEMMMCAGFVGL